MTTDKRNTIWLTRLQLSKDGELLADSHPDLTPDAFGDWPIAGLHAVANAGRLVALQFHGVEPTGFDNETIGRRIKSIRVTLHRHKGDAKWKIPYAVGGEEYVLTAIIAKER